MIYDIALVATLFDKWNSSFFAIITFQKDL